jgi:hypothetical protein
MALARPRRSPLASDRLLTPTTAGPIFPRAVAGEQYSRYAKSVWTHAQRWLTSHWMYATKGAMTVMDARLKLRAVAATDLNRHLNEQEEQLLSEIVQGAWTAGNEEPIDISLDRL